MDHGSEMTLVEQRSFIAQSLEQRLHSGAASDEEKSFIDKALKQRRGIEQRWEKLKQNREKQRRYYIATGKMQDPEKPRRLEDAITLVGECQDMCPEYERVQRIYQNDVWAHENEPMSLTFTRPARIFDEYRMVKKFRRSAAGNEEQLPSDLRPPTVLKQTLDYLFAGLLHDFKLRDVQTFIWDRTRAIRNDFSIQQVTRDEDVKIAIECFEQIVRFHILSMHEMSAPDIDVPDYSWAQDYEQMDKTLLSLDAYYSDNRDKKYQSPHEAEFRAYQVILCLKSPVPNIEDVISRWPPHIVNDKRIRKAVEIYNAGLKGTKKIGPLQPSRTPSFARDDWADFWSGLNSDSYSFLMVATAEICAMPIRDMVLKSFVKGFKQGGKKRLEDWTLEEMGKILGFEDLRQTRALCLKYGFKICKTADGTSEFVDPSSIGTRPLETPDGLPSQMQGRQAGRRRELRKASAIIQGLSVLEAQRSNLIIHSEHVLTENIDEEVLPEDKPLFVASDEESDGAESEPIVQRRSSAEKNKYDRFIAG
ncbi:uncharacterized protein BDZ99DRAFT_441571, partial [Mytilinidion resinicola]